MIPMDTDKAWEAWGAQDPYFGVLTDPKFRAEAMTPAAKDEFFVLGSMHADHVLGAIRRRLDPEFRPRSILDFGCGVGRVLVPFASIAETVVGVDVSPSMLEQARANCDARGAPGVVLLRSDDTLSAVTGAFDLVHTCIVLQHIPIPRGRLIFRELVQRVRPGGGCGALHVTFAWDHHAATFGQVPPPPPPVPPTLAGRLRTGLRRAWRLLRPLPPPQEARQDPEMQMNFYNLSELMFVLQQAGVNDVLLEITDHGGALGAFLYFRR